MMLNPSHFSREKLNASIVGVECKNVNTQRKKIPLLYTPSCVIPADPPRTTALPKAPRGVVQQLKDSRTKRKHVKKIAQRLAEINTKCSTPPLSSPSRLKSATLRRA